MEKPSFVIKNKIKISEQQFISQIQYTPKLKTQLFCLKIIFGMRPQVPNTYQHTQYVHDLNLGVPMIDYDTIEWLTLTLCSINL
jgi:hypothetical protein